MTTIEINLYAELLERYGPIIGGAELYTSLGFNTYAMFRLAKEGGEIAIPIFKIPGRRDWYALTSDVANWLLSLRKTSGQIKKEMDTKM